MKQKHVIQNKDMFGKGEGKWSFFSALSPQLSGGCDTLQGIQFQPSLKDWIDSNTGIEIKIKATLPKPQNGKHKIILIG